jgi:ornithine--oxo-acid transaminase
VGFEAPHEGASFFSSAELIAREGRVCAGNYAPLNVVAERACGARIWDAEGNCYLDFIGAYSALSHGHLHPRVVEALRRQLERVAVTSRALHAAALAPFLEELCRISGFERALPMNTGAEAVETAIKAVRRWAYRVKGIACGEAEILVARNNFHGRTTTLAGLSTQEDYRADFGPFAPGFRHFVFGDLGSMEAALNRGTCAVLMEPIQGEAGVIIPPCGYLRAVREWCDRHGLLLILDEIQSGLGRTGRMFAYEHERIRPDGLVLGKSLGGGLLPASAFLADEPLMSMFDAGSHGSTFGGNPLAAAVGLEALRVIEEEGLVQRSAELGEHLLGRLRGLRSGLLRDVRGKGLWAAMELDARGITARAFAQRLAARGVLVKDTHGTVVRLSPPLTIQRDDLDWAIDRVAATLAELEGASQAA